MFVCMDVMVDLLMIWFDLVIFMCGSLVVWLYRVLVEIIIFGVMVLFWYMFDLLI